MKQNITLSIDRELLRKVKHVAVDRGKSISGLLVEHLEHIVEQDEEYERARKRAIARIRRGMRLGGKQRIGREQLHER